MMKQSAERPREKNEGPSMAPWYESHIQKQIYAPRHAEKNTQRYHKKVCLDSKQYLPLGPKNVG